MLLIFDAAIDYGHLRQNLVHALICLAKEEAIFPFSRYYFTRYFGPFNKYLQMDIDGYADLGILDKKMTSASVGQYAYRITDLGTSHSSEIRNKIDDFDKVKNFVDEKMKAGHDVILDDAYRCLDSQVKRSLGK